MLAGHGTVSNHVPCFSGCFRQAGDGQTGRTDRDFGRAFFAIRNKNSINKIKRGWIEFVGYDIPQGSEVSGALVSFAGPDHVPWFRCRAVPTPYDIGQTESVA